MEMIKPVYTHWIEKLRLIFIIKLHLLILYYYHLFQDLSFKFCSYLIMVFFPVTLLFHNTTFY